MTEEKIRFGTVLDPRDPYQNEFITMSKRCPRKGHVLIGIMAHELKKKYGLNEENMNVLLPILLRDYKLIQTFTENKTDYKELAILLESSGDDFIRVMAVMAKEFFSSFGLTEKVSKEEINSIVNNYDWIKAAQKSYLSRPYFQASGQVCYASEPSVKKSDEIVVEQNHVDKNTEGPTIEDVMMAFPGIKM